MYEYKVYLYLDSSLKVCRTANFTSLEPAEELYQIGFEEGCYKYMLIIRDIERDMPIETKSIYYDNYRYNNHEYDRPKTHKRER